MYFFKRKNFESVKSINTHSKFNKHLGILDLILLGLGAIIGTGVFVVTGIVAANYSGPAITVSYVIAGITCIFVALVYTELATMLPSAGSIYTYSYIAFGEIFAWIMGGVIIAEIGFAIGIIAGGWSEHVQSIFQAYGIDLPHALTHSPDQGGIINLPSLFIIVFISLILCSGTKDNKKLTSILVFIKIIAIAIFIIAALPHFKLTNWTPFMPFGFDNVLTGASILFWTFIGFSIITTAAEECKNPKRDLKFGIIGSLIISTIVYVIIGGLLTGIISYHQLNNNHPLTHALQYNNNEMGGVIVAVGAICGITTALMGCIYAMSRIFYVIARDGLLPKSLAKLHPKYQCPYRIILLSSAFSAFVSTICPMEILIKLSAMGSLVDYIVIAIIVMVFRFQLPDAKRPFKCPVVFITAPTALIASAYLLYKQIWEYNFTLSLAGKLFCYWFIAIFILYLVRSGILLLINKK